MSVRLEQLLAGQEGWHLDTDEPWRVRADDGYPVAFCGTLPGTTDPNPVRAERSADLIALAPYMGRLLIDMGEALKLYYQFAPHMGGCGFYPLMKKGDCDCGRKELDALHDALLARLERLGKDTA